MNIFNLAISKHAYNQWKLRGNGNNIIDVVNNGVVSLITDTHKYIRTENYMFVCVKIASGHLIKTVLNSNMTVFDRYQ